MQCINWLKYFVCLENKASSLHQDMFEFKWVENWPRTFLFIFSHVRVIVNLEISWQFASVDKQNSWEETPELTNHPLLWKNALK